MPVPEPITDMSGFERPWAVIVCYRPDSARLGRLCHALREAGCAVVVVDNTEGSYVAAKAAQWDIRVLALQANTGIGHALNVGIDHALAAGADLLYYFDQDSDIEQDTIAALAAALAPGRLGVASPIYFDRVVGYEFPAQRRNWPGVLRHEYSRGKTAPYPVDVVISSGMAVTAPTYRAVGLMDESLFIDLVDTEWCLRCRSRGVPILVVPAARMRHSIGSRTASLGWIRLAVHPPIRCYYQIRNCLLLFRYPHVPWFLALFELARVLANRALLLLVTRKRGEYLHSYCVAVRDGVKGIGGGRESLARRGSRLGAPSI